MASLQVVLFLLMAVGFFVKKTGLVQPAMRNGLSTLIVDVVLPCNIIESFMNEKVTPELLRNSLVVLLIACAEQVLSVALSRVLYRRAPDGERAVLRYATINSNATFIGLPVIGNLYGTIGVLYAAVAIIPLRIAMWSFGLSLFAATEKKKMARSLLLHPCIVAVYIGFALMLLHPPLPVFLTKTIGSISDCTTFLSMMTIGLMIETADPKSFFSKSILEFSAVRLLILPLITFAALWLLRENKMVIGISTLIMAMPAGTTTAILASKYNCRPEFASKIVFVTTLLSMLTLPAVSLLL